MLVCIQKNGKRLSDTDKRHAIVLALQTWPDKDSGSLAAQIGTHQTYVARVRQEVKTSLNLPDHVTGKDGKRYPASRCQPSIEPPGWHRCAIVRRGNDFGLRPLAFQAVPLIGSVSDPISFGGGCRLHGRRAGLSGA